MVDLIMVSCSCSCDFDYGCDSNAEVWKLNIEHWMVVAFQIEFAKRNYH
jgi:hypothetical protein